MPQIEIISTDAVPEYLNAVSVEIFRLWREFALGSRHLGGRKLLYPTGRYASSISMVRRGSRVTTVRQGREFHTRMITSIAIVANEQAAPEAAILETGHKGIDMLQHLAPDTYYPMHRSGPVPASVRQGAASFPRDPSQRRRVRQIWSQIRETRATGRAKTPLDPSMRGPMNTSHTGPAWYIPPMPMYEPAHILAELYANAKGLDITVS